MVLRDIPNRLTNSSASQSLSIIGTISRMSSNPWRSSSSINRSKVSFASRSEIRSNWSCRVSSLAANSSTSVLRRARRPPARRSSAYQCARFKNAEAGLVTQIAVVLPRQRVHGSLCDFRYTPNVAQDAGRDLPQRVGDRDNAMLHPCAMDRVSLRVDIPDADWNDGKVRFLVVIRKDDASAHGPVPRRKKLSAFICVHLRLIILVGLLVGFLCRSGCRGILL